MAKKSWGTSDKVQEARERKATGKAQAREAEAKAKDDAYWDAHANPRGKKDAKREAAERAREEAAARKAEARRLAAAEEASLTGAGRKAVSKPKMTHHQLMQQRERDQRARRAKAEEEAAPSRREVRGTSSFVFVLVVVGRTCICACLRAQWVGDEHASNISHSLAHPGQVTEDAYAATVEVENTNVRDRDTIDASGLDQALQQMVIGEGGKQDMHPERCVDEVDVC